MNNPKLFLSYSSKDTNLVTKFRDAFESAGLPCWMAVRDIPAGATYSECIVDAISRSCGIVVFLSKDSVASPEVEKEIGLAAEEKKKYYPVQLDDSSPSPTTLPKTFRYHLTASQWTDARKDFPSAVQSIVKAVMDDRKNALELLAEEDDHSELMSRSPAEWYETRRNGLLALLGEATALNLPERYAGELRQTAKKCQEDAFEIALVGEFQGGKSTTFNAMCDGRDISPRGLGGGGIKTSAAVISAQNIAGDDTKNGYSEWAEITFKSPSSIALGLSTILRRPLADSEEFRKYNGLLSDEEFSSALVTDDGFVSLVRLDDPDCRKILLGATDELWSKWEENHACLSDDDLDQLRIATLQIRLFGSPKYDDMLDETILPIDKFQKLIAFPKDWTTRWTSGQHTDFTIDEVAFVFVHAVLVQLHSENLQRLGCRITDCPGLFANAYDTSVARRTILNADAVWYLINGEKQIGQKDLEIIRTIADMGMLGKIEATCNLRGPHEQKIAEIIPATKASLSNAGHDIDVYPYNARLAFLATQGDLLIHRPELFSDLDRTCMLIDSKAKGDNPDPAAMWAKMVRRTGSSTELEDLENIDGLDTEAVASVRKESMLDGILSRLETNIVPQKARSILVDKGSDRAARALIAYEGILKATENAAETDEKKWRTETENAKATLADFVNRANASINRSALYADRDELAANMAQEVIAVAFDAKFIDNLANQIGEVVKKRYSKLYIRKKNLRRDLMAEISPVVSNTIKSALGKSLHKWRKQKSSASHKTLKRRIDDLVESLQEIWETNRLENAELATLSIPAMDSSMISECEEIAFDNIFSEKDLNGIQMTGILDGIGKILIVGIVGTVIVGIGIVILGEAAVPAAAIAGAARGLYCWLTETTEEKEAKEKAKKETEKKIEQEELGKIASKIRPKLCELIANDEFRKKIEMPLTTAFREFQEGVVQMMRTSLKTLQSDFANEHIAESEKMFSKTAENRKRIAAENALLRTKTIEPLRRKIEAYKHAVLREINQ